MDIDYRIIIHIGVISDIVLMLAVYFTLIRKKHFCLSGPCGPIPAFSFASVKLVSSLRKTQAVVCHRGYRFETGVTEVRLICQRGKWSKPPKCKRKDTLALLDYVSRAHMIERRPSSVVRLSFVCAIG